MAISLKRTGGIENSFIKFCVYGDSGSGKTKLITTMPNVITISAEGGLLSIADEDLPYIEVSSLADLEEVYQWLTESEEGLAFDSVALDSISEVAEVVLSNEKKNTKDGRAAYGEMADKMTSIIRGFRDLPEKHVYFSAKMDKVQDQDGRMIYGPSMPGKTLTRDLPYYFDEFFALRVEKDGEGNQWRGLLTAPDGMWSAKDRSGKLEQWETPDLGEIIKKIQATKEA